MAYAVIPLLVLFVTIGCQSSPDSFERIDDVGSDRKDADAEVHSDDSAVSSPDSPDAANPVADLSDSADADADNASEDAGPPRPEPLWSLDFTESPLGDYDETRIRADWEGVRWASPAGRTSIEEEAGNRFLRVQYPAGGVGPGEGGAQWRVDLDQVLSQTFDELYVFLPARTGPRLEHFPRHEGHGLAGMLHVGSGVVLGIFERRDVPRAPGMSVAFAAGSPYASSCPSFTSSSAGICA